MTDIAREAGVGKPTVYLRWPSKAALVVEAMAAAMHRSPFPDSGDVRTDLVAGLRHMIGLLSTTVAGAALPGLLADLGDDPELARLFELHYLEPRWASLRAALQRGIDRGELPGDLDMDLVIDALFGPIYYRLFVRHDELHPADADHLTDLVLIAARCGALTARPTPSA
jgi:AcrR family transcriptional regulator